MILNPASFYSANINIPASKSYFQRALALSSHCSSPISLVGNASDADTLAAISILENFGHSISKQEQSVIVQPSKLTDYNSVSIHCGESGLCARMFTPLAASLFNSVQVTGNKTLLNRPLTEVILLLKQAGCKITSTNCKLPISIEGKLNAGKYSTDGSETSQLVTGLLLTLPFLNDNSELIVNNPGSIPYIEMTLCILKDFGINIKHYSYSHFFIHGNNKIKQTEYKIEGDWSSAAFHIVGAALKGDALISNLNENSTQADKEILKVLERVGGYFEWKNEHLHIQKSELKPFEYNLSHCPDLFPALSILALGCNGKSILHGTRRLIHKESNRAEVILRELSKTGAEIKLEDNALVIHGGKELKGTEINPHGDHRIAMASALLSLLTVEKIGIQNHECVSKSYPFFFNDFTKSCIY